MIIKIYQVYCINKLNKPKQMTQKTPALSQTHILKILLKQRPVPIPKSGIICNPKQTYGVSKQSPSQLNTTNGITADNGYLYQQEQDRKNKQLFLPPFSQMINQKVIGDNSNSNSNGYILEGDIVDKYRKQYQNNPQRFHRRKGRLSDFMDHNGWMNQVYKMMGFQRSDQARTASNKDRQLCIKSARRTIAYDNPVQKKISTPKQNYIKSTLLTQRVKVRHKRLSLQKQKREALDIQKMMTITSKKSPQKNQYIDAQNLTNYMSRTANQKQWKDTMSSIRNKYRVGGYTANVREDRGLTSADWSVNNVNRSVEISTTETPLLQNVDQLKEWFNSTCNTKANPWAYRKAKKMATGSDQEILD